MAMNFSKTNSSSSDRFNDYGSTPDYVTNINNDMEVSITAARTLEILNICKKKVIAPFNVLFIIIGWRPFTAITLNSDSQRLIVFILNIVLNVSVISMVILSYIYQVVACRFFMNKKDMIRNISVLPFELGSTIRPSENQEAVYANCTHLTTSYVIPSIIHFVAYIIGLIHYRIQQNEDIYGLMEKTFQYSHALGTHRNGHSKITCALTLWMLSSIALVSLSMVSHILYDIAYDQYSAPTLIFDGLVSLPARRFLFFCDFLGFIISSTITTVIILNYALHCEVMKFYIDAVSKKIEMRCIKLQIIKSDIHNISVALSLINGTIGTMTTIIFTLLSYLLLVGVYMATYEYSQEGKPHLAFRIYYAFHIMPYMLVPLIQCVRVNQAIRYLKKWAMNMSVFGYRKEKRKELNSFLLYNIGFKTKVKVWFLPLEWHHLILFLIASGLVLIVLVQADMIPILSDF